MECFVDHIAVVTGGGNGIGAALAREAAKRGARVAVADIRLDAARCVADEIGSSARPFHVDVTDDASVATFSAAVQSEMGGVNLLFANAGVITVGGLPETTAKDIAWLFDVNVLGLYRTILAFLPALKHQAKLGKPAHIISTGSENSVGLPLMGATTAYTGTKHAVLGLSDGLRRDLKETGITVSVLCPGLVVSNLADARSTRHARYGGAVELPREQMDQIITFCRENGQLPEDTAWFACEGVSRGDFLIMADPRIRQLADTRNNEIQRALDLLDSQLASGKPDRRA